MIFKLIAWLRPIYYWVSPMPGLVPLLLLPVSAFLGGRAWRWLPAPQPQTAIPVMLIAFGLLDWALLTLLPAANLSYGPTGLPLLGLTALRFALVLAAAGLLLAVNLLPGGLTPRITAIGLILVGILNLGMLAVEIDGLFIEPFSLQVTEISTPGPVSLRIVQLSDLHVERITRRERAVIEQVNGLHPDLIVLTGDYLNLSYNHDPIAQRDARQVLSQLSATYGIYAIPGSPAVDTPDALEAVFSENGSPAHTVRLLNDESLRIPLNSGDVYLLGITLKDVTRDRAILEELMAEIPSRAYTILLYHTPELADAAANSGVNLYFAGHTHGGQIRLPFFGALYTATPSRQYDAGEFFLDNTILYVSRGIGMEGRGAPRVRFLCPPEIVVIDLVNP